VKWDGPKQGDSERARRWREGRECRRGDGAGDGVACMRHRC
jgi:hypothetical protein